MGAARHLQHRRPGGSARQRRSHHLHGQRRLRQPDPRGHRAGHRPRRLRPHARTAGDRGSRLGLPAAQPVGRIGARGHRLRPLVPDPAVPPARVRGRHPARERRPPCVDAAGHHRRHRHLLRRRPARERPGRLGGHHLLGHLRTPRLVGLHVRRVGAVVVRLRLRRPRRLRLRRRHRPVLRPGRRQRGRHLSRHHRFLRHPLPAVGLRGPGRHPARPAGDGDGRGHGHRREPSGVGIVHQPARARRRPLCRPAQFAHVRAPGRPARHRGDRHRYRRRGPRRRAVRRGRRPRRVEVRERRVRGNGRRPADVHAHLHHRRPDVHVRHRGGRPVQGDGRRGRHRCRPQPQRAHHLGQRRRERAHPRRGAAGADGGSRQGQLRPRRHRRTAGAGTLRQRHRPHDHRAQRHPRRRELHHHRRQRRAHGPDHRGRHPVADARVRGGRRGDAHRRRRHRPARCPPAAGLRGRQHDPLRAARVAHPVGERRPARHRSEPGRLHHHRRVGEGRERGARAGCRVRGRRRRRSGARPLRLRPRRPARRVLHRQLRLPQRGVRPGPDPARRPGVAGGRPDGRPQRGCQRWHGRGERPGRLRDAHHDGRRPAERRRIGRG